MITPTSNGRCISTLKAIIAISLLFSLVAYSQYDDNDTNTSSNDSLPAIGQALVPEGVFATQLAEALQLGSFVDEAKAEALLSNLVIEPKNGWISEYPVTPAVLGELEKQVGIASEQKKIPFTKDQALNRVSDVESKLGLNVRSTPSTISNPIQKPVNTTIYRYTDKKGEIHITDRYDSIPKQYFNNVKKISQPPVKPAVEGMMGPETTYGSENTASPDAEYINQYYENDGPPVVTYYAPPDPYAYLYSWVSYPFWSTGYYFPGYFVLNNFHRQVQFNRHQFFVHHHDNNGPNSNRWNQGLGNQAPDRHFAANTPWFSNPNAQAGARQIVNLIQDHARLINKPFEPGMSVSGRMSLPNRNFSPFTNRPTEQPSRNFQSDEIIRNNPIQSFNRPAFTQRYFEPNFPRSNFSPNQGQVFRPAPAEFGGFNRGNGIEGGGFAHPQGGSRGGRR